MTPRLLPLFLLITSFGCASLPASEPIRLEPWLEAAASHDVRILRDEFGVPHIYGKTDPDVSFGLAYAHAQDDFETIQKVLLQTRGVLAAVDGMDASTFDYLVHLLGFWEDV